VTWEPPDLTGAVAVVTGASRGVGRGVALALGDAGATVYVTGRSTRDGTRTEDLPGTVDDTADEVTKRGGTGIAVRCDHTSDAETAALFERVGQERGGRLDLLVNNAWGGYAGLAARQWDQWTAPFWAQPLSLFDDMFASGVRAHYVALATCAPLLIATPGSLAVTVSVAIPDADLGSHGVAYAMAKAADDRLAAAAAVKLREQGVASVAVYPGWVRTETVLLYSADLDLAGSQSPEGVGRAITALAADPDVMALTGRALSIDELAARYKVDVSA
jgi:NAD(P)-dependent dehydrogenase (short-subunit alcohol dehydrogenase family)